MLSQNINSSKFFIWAWGGESGIPNWYKSLTPHEYKPPLESINILKVFPHWTSEILTFSKVVIFLGVKILLLLRPVPTSKESSQNPNPNCPFEPNPQLLLFNI